MDNLISLLQIAPTLASTLAPPVATSLALAAFVALMALAALRDMGGATIPNRLILWLAAGYATLAPLAGFAPREMLVALGVAAMVFFASVAAIALGWMEGSDSKLLTVAALWLGPEAVPLFLMLTLGLGGVAALSLLTLRNLPDGRLPAGGTKARSLRLARLALAKDRLPGALPIGLAALLCLPATPWLAGL